MIGKVCGEVSTASFAILYGRERSSYSIYSCREFRSAKHAFGDAGGLHPL